MPAKNMIPAIEATPWNEYYRSYPNGVKYGSRAYKDWCKYLQWGHTNKLESAFYYPAYRYTSLETKDHWKEEREA